MIKRLALPFVATTVLAACGSTPSASSVTAPASLATLDSFAGAWTAVSTSTPLPTLTINGIVVGLCSGGTYMITPTAASQATVSYSGTCSGMAITGTGTGVLSESMLTWSTVGQASSCAFSLTGTATPIGTELQVTYAGTVCGGNVAGTQMLSRK